MKSQMDCSKSQSLLSALLDGELTPGEREAVLEHVAGCPACSRELDDLKRVDAAFEDMTPVFAPESFEREVQAAIRRSQVMRARRTGLRRAWPYLSAAAAAVVLLAAGLSLMMSPARRFEMASAPDAAPAPQTAETKALGGGAPGGAASVSDARTVEVPPELEEELRAIGYMAGDDAAKGAAGGNTEPDRELSKPEAPKERTPETPSETPQRMAKAEAERISQVVVTEPTVAAAPPLPSPPRAPAPAAAPAPEPEPEPKAPARSTPVPEPKPEAAPRSAPALAPEGMPVPEPGAAAAVSAPRAEAAPAPMVEMRAEPPAVESMAETKPKQNVTASFDSVEQRTRLTDGNAPAAADAVRPAPVAAPLAREEKKLASSREQASRGYTWRKKGDNHLPTPAPPLMAAAPVMAAEPSMAEPPPPEAAKEAPPDAAQDRSTHQSYADTGRIVAEPAAPEPKKPEPKKPEKKEIGTRTFEKRDGVWTQQEYAGQEPERVLWDSRRAKSLMKRYPELREIKSLGGTVIVALDKTWWRFE